MNFLRSKETKLRAQEKKWASWNREEAKMQAWHNRLGEDSSESSIINTHTSEEAALARGLRSSWAKQQPTPQQIQQTRQNRIKMLERNNKERLRNRLFPKQNQQSIRNGFRNTRSRSRNTSRGRNTRSRRRNTRSRRRNTSRGRNTRRRSIRRNSNNNNTQGWCEWVRDIVTGKRTKKCYSNKKRN